MSASFDTDWTLPPDERPTRPVPPGHEWRGTPQRVDESYLLLRVLEDLGRMSREDIARVRKLVNEVLR